MLEQRHHHLFFQIAFQGWRYLDQVLLRRIQDQLHLRDVLQIKQLEEPVDHIDAAQVTFSRGIQPILGKHDLLGSRHVCFQPTRIQPIGNPDHFGPPADRFL